MIKNILLILLLLTFPKLSYSINVGVINIETLISNNKNYISINKEIDKEYDLISKNFEKKELELENLLTEIEDSKNILSNNEINNLVSNYNEKLNILQVEIDKFNLHFQNEVIRLRKKILEEIIVLVEDYVNDYGYDLILDSNNYLISSNSINITKNIQEKLDKLDLKLEFNSFEKN